MVLANRTRILETEWHHSTVDAASVAMVSIWSAIFLNLHLQEEELTEATIAVEAWELVDCEHHWLRGSM